ncbi:MAG: flagellar hook-associated protein FlgK [Lachnospiraceae bacterium]|nr:flagellar hook-associated protein FlgK [Lachnospiraceae bacterium]
MSLFTSFGVGVSGLRTSQSGLNTTAHNLANTNTVGYTRQQNINTDTYYRTVKLNESGKLKSGLGTTVAEVRQIRDIFLDKEYRLEVSRQSFYEKQVECGQEVEDVLGETEGVEFREAMNDIWNNLQDLSTNPESVVNRELFISQTESFLEKAKDIYSAISDYQIGLNNEISVQVNKINAISDKIAKYNGLIAKAEASGVENANDYRDARNQLMDELAGFTYFTYNEDSKGMVQIYINNAPLVLETKGYHMGCEKMKIQEFNEETQEFETNKTSPMYKVVWKDNGYGEVYNVDEAYSKEKKTDTGSLLGLLTARGSGFATYKDMPVEPKESDFYNEDGELDDVGLEAFKVAKEEYKESVKKYNNTTGNSILTRVEAQFDQLINGIVNMINSVFCPEISLKSLGGILGTNQDGEEITLEDGKSYKILDVVNCPVGADDDATVGNELFARTGIKRYTVINLDSQVYSSEHVDEEGNEIGLARQNPDGTYSLYVYNEEDESDISTMYTLDNLEINKDILANYSLLAVKANESKGMNGAYDQDIYKEMISNWGKEFAVLDPDKLTSYSFDDYYTEMVGALGTQDNIWAGKVDNQEKLTESIEDRRQQISGVSTEEELVNLLTYQHAYNAASRYINTVDQMLQYLIEKLG